MSAPLARKHWLQLAERYAALRWFWVDPSQIAETAELTMRPDLWVDAEAESCGMTDPSDPWVCDSYDAERVAALRQRIVFAWVEGGGKAEGE